MGEDFLDVPPPQYSSLKPSSQDAKGKLMDRRKMEDEIIIWDKTQVSTAFLEIR